MKQEPGAQRATPLTRIIDAALVRAGGWLSFDRFMAMALYAPGMGYYANDSRKFGRMPTSGSDFVTAPELTPLFGRALAVQVAEALERTVRRRRPPNRNEAKSERISIAQRPSWPLPAA